MKKFLLVVLTVCLSGMAYGYPNQPVQYGSDDDLDACGGYGIATVSTVVYTKDKDGFLKIEKVNAGQDMMSCDYVEDSDGEYVGVVIREKGKDCKVSSPVEGRQDYKGPCRSGWIEKKYFLLIAG